VSWQHIEMHVCPHTVVRRLNELYKSSVAFCRSLSTRLEHFFSRKHRLMDQITSITAERLLFSHTVQMVSRQGGGGVRELGCRGADEGY